MAHAAESEPNPPSRILLVDASPTFRDGLDLAITRTKTLILVGRAGSAAELFANEKFFNADIALVDVDLPDQSGFEVCQRLLHFNPKLKVVLLSSSDWDIYLVAAQSVHACGLLLRSQTTPALIAALEKSATGPVFSQEQLRHIVTWKNTVGTKLRSLSHREWQVLQLLALGLGNREVSQRCAVSENTVEKHLGSIREKLELESRGTMIVFFFDHHLDLFNRLPHGERFLLQLTN